MAAPHPSPDRTRRIPSDCRPQSLGQRERIRRLARTWFPNGLEPKGEPDGPHYLAMVAFLQQFVNTPSERAVFDVYFQWSRPKPEDVPVIQQTADAEGLTLREYVARETLRELRRFVQANGVPTPEAASAESETKMKRRRRKRAGDVVRPLTPRQLEAMQLYGECKGNFAEMGRRMGLDRKTAKQHYDAAASKVGPKAVAQKPETNAIAHDCRGQADISDIDDARRGPDSTDARRYKRRG